MINSRLKHEQSFYLQGVMELAPHYESNRVIDYRVVFINDICLNIFESSAIPDDISTLSELIPDEPSFKSVMQQLDMSSEFPFSPDVGFLFMKGPVGIYITVQQISSQLIRMVCVDLTDLMDVMQRSDDLYAHMQSPVAILSETGEILNVNRYWQRLSGFEKTQLLATNILDHVHPSDRDCVSSRLLLSSSGADSCKNQIRLIGCDGTYRILELISVRVGRNILISGNDITERVQRQQFIDRQAQLYAMFMDSTIAGFFFSMREDPIDISSIDLEDETLLLSLLHSEHIVEVNEMFLEQVRRTREVVIGSALSDFFHWDIGKGIRHFRTAISEGKVVAEGRFPVSEHTERWISVNISNVYDEAGRLRGHIGIQIDITEKKIQEQELRNRENNYRILTEFARDMIWIYNLDTHRFTFLSPAVEGVLGWTPDEVKSGGLGLLVTERTLHTLNQQIERFSEEFRRNGKVSSDATVRIEHKRKDGKKVHSESLLNFRYNEEGQLEVIGISRDISETKRAEEHLVFTSYHDQLTGVYNRRFLKDFLNEGLDTSHYPLSIILCDLNGLKLTNDVFGHSIGDTLIVENAQLLSSFARSSDIVTREGGDEFVMLLPATTAEKAHSIVEAMRNRCKEISVNELHLSTAFGTATLETMKDEYYSAYHTAEKHLYADKLKTSPEYKKELIDTFLKSLFTSDKALERHSLSVSLLCGRIAQVLSLDDAKIEQLTLAGKLHDIGIIGLDTRMMPDVDYKMSEGVGEYARHAELGYHIISSVPMYGEIATWILAHHEQPDGKGYPRNLSGVDIPLESHIIHVANDYDLLMDKHGQNTGTVLSIMGKGRKSRYPVKVLDALMVCIDKGSC
ncbi:MAG: diguanylate cyclase [Sphaerochaetaceae bacterium]|nr:diguanylate cyclase [Sphaerochaetaceae bacterium]